MIISRGQDGCGSLAAQ